MVASCEFALDGRVYSATRVRLGQFLLLQEARERLFDAAVRWDTGGIADGIFAFIGIACPDAERSVLEAAPWAEVITAYHALDGLNGIPGSNRFSMLTVPMSGKSPAWGYVGRARYMWIHIIASAYGWAKEEIESLWPEDAVALIQEIIADEQIRREFLHSLSEIAYPFDPTTKKNHYEPLPRPAWMVMSGQADKAKTKATRIHKVMLPSGNVVYPEGQEPDWVAKD